MCFSVKDHKSVNVLSQTISKLQRWYPMYNHLLSSCLFGGIKFQMIWPSAWSGPQDPRSFPQNPRSRSWFQWAAGSGRSPVAFQGHVNTLMEIFTHMLEWIEYLKKTHFLKLTFHIFQIPSSIFILFYFKQFPPKLLVFSSKSSPTRWCKKKPQASSVSWVMRSLATSNLAWRAAITYQPNQLNSTNHQVSVPREISTNRGKHPKTSQKIFGLNFFEIFWWCFSLNW